MPAAVGNSRPADLGDYPHALLRRVRAAGLLPDPVPGPVLTEADLDGLPEAARRYLRFMGVVGRPRARSLRARLAGTFRLGPHRSPMRCQTWQYNTVEPVARMFMMRLMFGGVLPMTAWDIYGQGHGRMIGRLLGLVPVARGSGPMFDTSELVTWLDDALLMAPSMLLGTATTWRQGTGENSFQVTVSDVGRTVAAEVSLTADGALREVRTDDRYADLPGGLVRARWSTPVDGWEIVDGCPRFTRARAAWHLGEGPFCYAELTPQDVVIAG